MEFLCFCPLKMAMGDYGGLTVSPLITSVLVPLSAPQEHANFLLPTPRISQPFTPEIAGASSFHNKPVFLIGFLVSMQELYGILS